MAFPTAVNDQITDAVSQSNLSVLGQSSAMAIGVTTQALGHSFALGLQAQQATSARQAILREAITAKCAAQLVQE